MAIMVNFGIVSKRRNSTLQPALSSGTYCNLKDATSLDNPTFILEAPTFPFNYAQWEDRYYFINDVKSVRNNIWEVNCIIDPLATAKSYILASTQYVSYSSVSGSSWLPDTRIPLLSSTSISTSTASIPIISTTGFYCLTAIGETGCVVNGLTLNSLQTLLSRVSSWSENLISDINNQMYDFSSVEAGLQSLGKMTTQTGVLGNAYADAPNCIRSCIWVPFNMSSFETTGTGLIYLGQFNTDVVRHPIRSSPVTGTISVSIPWHYSDWRRSVCEDVYLYLPFVGMASISGDSLTQTATLSIKYSATATDGVISYEVKAGNAVVASYGGQCSSNYPIGISQQASAGAIANSVISGMSKEVAAFTKASLNPISMVGAVAEAAMTGVETAYNTANIALTRHNTCVGGIGGGAGSGLDLNVICYTVSHAPVISPSEMQSTMGLPTMKPMQLSPLSGYCQCANAHVAAPFDAHVLDAVDSYLNSGFYIE